MVLLVVAVYTGALIALLGGGGSDTKVRTVVERGAKGRPLTPLERQVKKSVQDAALFQKERTDVPTFRRPQVASVRCQAEACRVVYAISVPGRGRILFQQLNMVRAIFRDTDLDKVVLRVVRVQPTGPEAIHKSEEETPAGFPLLESTCLRKNAPGQVRWRTQKEAQAGVSKACEVKAFDQGQFHGNVQGPG